MMAPKMAMMSSPICRQDHFSKSGASYMLLTKYKAIHIHITKCAGASIERAFKKRLFQHFTKQDFVLRYGLDTWDSYFKFAFVRNPWDRFVSLYFYMVSKPEQFKDKTRGMNFKQYLSTLLNNPNKGDDILNSWQHAWIYDSKGLMVDFVGRFENLHEDFAKVCKAIGAESITLGHHNKTNHAHYSHYYDDELIDIVRKGAATDIKLFRYEFEDKRDCAM